MYTVFKCRWIHWVFACVLYHSPHYHGPSLGLVVALAEFLFCFFYDIKFLQKSASMKQEWERQGLPPFQSHQVCGLCKDLLLQCQAGSYSPQRLFMHCASGLNPAFLYKTFFVCAWGTLHHFASSSEAAPFGGINNSPWSSLCRKWGSSLCVITQLDQAIEINVEWNRMCTKYWQEIFWRKIWWIL